MLALLFAPMGWNASCPCRLNRYCRACISARPIMPAWWNGRHKRLKISGPEGRAGSIPAAGTIVNLVAVRGVKRAVDYR